MGKASRKPSPSMPYWYWLDVDDCYFCSNRRNCNNCSTIRKHLKEYKILKKRDKIAKERRDY